MCLHIPRAAFRPLLRSSSTILPGYSYWAQAGAASVLERAAYCFPGLLPLPSSPLAAAGHSFHTKAVAARPHVVSALSVRNCRMLGTFGISMWCCVLGEFLWGPQSSFNSQLFI